MRLNISPECVSSHTITTKLQNDDIEKQINQPEMTPRKIMKSVERS